MLSIDDALEKILAQSIPTKKLLTATLKTAFNQILAEDQFATVDVPPNDNSAMDGYAVRVEDVEKKQTLPISQIIKAGSIASPLTPGTAARIFTGAEIPAGANAVVMQEECKKEDNLVTLPNSLTPQQNIRPRGQDIKQGDCLVQRGQRLNPAHIGLLATSGIANFPVFKPLSVAIFSTSSSRIVSQSFDC